MEFLIRLVITAIGVMLASQLVPGISVSSFWSALGVALALGILNATLGLFLKVITLPLSVLTFGLFLLVINALVFWACSFIKGFTVSGFWPAFFGSLVVTFITMVGRHLVK